LHKQINFPKTHSISHLLDILENSGVKIPKRILVADILSQYAVQTRYPGPVEEVALEEYKESLEISARVVFWAETVISK
jgi:HEPN domain-containing protein